MAFVNAMVNGTVGRDRPGAVPMSERPSADEPQRTFVNPAIRNLTRSSSPKRRSEDDENDDEHHKIQPQPQQQQPSQQQSRSSSAYTTDPANSFMPMRASRAEQRRRHLAPFAAPAPETQFLRNTTGGGGGKKEELWQKEHFGNLAQARWVQQCPHFGEEKRFKPTETWNAISPKFAPLDKVFPNLAHQQHPATRSGTTDTLTSEDWNFRSLSEIEQQQSRSTSPTTNTTSGGGAGAAAAAAGGTTTRGGSVVDPRDPTGTAHNNPFAYSPPPPSHHQTGSSSAAGVGVSSSSSSTPTSAISDDADLADDSWQKNRLLSIGTTSNPYSQRLFSKLAKNRLEKERAYIDNEAGKGMAPHFDKQVMRRSANNLLPPTPFSQTVDVLPGPLPHWTRRLEPARDLDAAQSSDDDSGDDDDRRNIYDEFLLAEMEAAKNETPRTERRGEFYRLPLQPPENFLRIYDRPPQEDKDPNQAALEYLMVNRPEFAPALRRLSQRQMELIDWSSLFRGGTHHDVSVTSKPFPHGVPWATSPFSEAPVETGALGFVGNLVKRDEEAKFFSKLHGSHDGRVESEKFDQWMREKCPIRFSVSEEETRL